MENNSNNININLINNKLMNRKQSLKWILTKYDKAFQNEDSSVVPQIDKEYPFIAIIYVNIGMDRIRELDYNQKKINHELFIVSKDRIRKLVLEVIKKKERYSVAYIKRILKVIYTMLSIDKKAKSTDLSLLFRTESSFMNDDTGKTVRYIAILE